MILVTALGIAAPVYRDYRERARVVQAIVDIRTLEHDIYIYEADGRGLPMGLDKIGRENLLDPWRRPYQYLSKNDPHWNSHRRHDHFDHPLNEDFDLYSRGKDGQSRKQLFQSESLDDVVRANEGRYVGLASEH